MDDLHCNSLKCRKPLALEGSAVVTTCSHIFCVECANILFSTPQICPACDTALPDSDDVVQTALNPPDAYKTSVLSGLAPTIILDIASRAMNFYTYQIQQECAFQSLLNKNAQERISTLEAQNSAIMRDATSEITLLKERIASAERDLELERRKVRELRETHKANAKAYNKLKDNYDREKKKNMLLSGDSTVHALNTHAANAAPRQAFASVASGATPMRAASASTSSQHQSQGLNRQQYGWQTNTAAGGGVPLAHQPGGSAQRPRQSFQDHHQQQDRSASAVQFGHGGNGQAPGVMPMPVKKTRGSGGVGSTGSVGSNGSGSGSGGTLGRAHMQQQQQQRSEHRAHLQQQQQVPDYLGQRNSSRQSMSGGFRPASFVN